VHGFDTRGTPARCSFGCPSEKRFRTPASSRHAASKRATARGAASGGEKHDVITLLPGFRAFPSEKQPEMEKASHETPPSAVCGYRDPDHWAPGRKHGPGCPKAAVTSEAAESRHRVRARARPTPGQTLPAARRRSGTERVRHPRSHPQGSTRCSDTPVRRRTAPLARFTLQALTRHTQRFGRTRSRRSALRSSRNTARPSLRCFGQRTSLTHGPTPPVLHLCWGSERWVEY